MGEMERAHRLSKAIDQLLQGKEPELEDEELMELLEIAKRRHQAARDAAGLARKYQDFIWARLEARIVRVLDEHSQKPDEMAKEKGGGAIDAASEAADNPNFDDLRDTIARRHRLSEEMATMAEAYRDKVWQRVQSRIKAHEAEKKRRLFPFRFGLPSRQREREEADRLAKAIDGMILGEPIWEASDSRLNDLLRLARLRQAWGDAVAASAAPHQERIWQRLWPRLASQPGKSSAPESAGARGLGASWPKLAAVAAGLALLVLAVGPLPATGLADHPFTQLVGFVGEKVGVTETSAPLPVASVTESISGDDVSLDEAREITGLPLREPGYLPEGFEKASSKYFPQGITADQGGVFELAYDTAGSDTALLIWQEAAAGNDVAVQTGFAQSVILGEGVEATYFQGMWQTEGGEVVWGAPGTQTVIFDKDELRTVILYLGDDPLDMQTLLAIASSTVAQP